MATYNRRIVYLSDEEWAQAREDATGMSMSISGYVRAMLTGSLDQPRVSPRMTFHPPRKAELANPPTAETIMALDADAFEGRMRATGMEAQVQTALSRKGRQAERDAILRKINRGG